MKARPISCFLFFLAIGFVMAQEPAKRPMTTDDGMDLVRIANPVLSPDGEWVFFSQTKSNWKEKRAKTTYFMVSSEGGEPYQFIGKDGGSAFRFSPDGKYLSFTRSVGEKEKKQQIFLMRTRGGEAVQLTKHASSVGSYQWSDDSRKIFFVATEPRGKEEEKLYKAGYDAIFVDEGPSGQQEARWNNLWVFDVEAKKEKRITKEDFRIGGFDISPDGRQILFTARYENRRNQRNLSEIYLFNLQDSTKVRLTENRAPEGGLVWAPDGRRFLYSAVGDGEWELRNSKLWIMDIESMEKQMISGGYVGRISNPVWTLDSRTIYFIGRQRTDANLFRLDVKSGEVIQVSQITGSMGSASFSQDRTRMAYTYQNFNTPADLYVTGTKKFNSARLTDVNPLLKKDFLLASGSVVRWKSKDGLEIEGLLYLPESYQEGAKIPLLLHIHGGPAGCFTNSFRHSYHVFAGLGYAQLCPNVRGSSGYSDELLRGNMQDIGGGDYWDLMTGVDYLIEKGIADPERMGVRGWSYGGILGGWVLTQTERFKAASLGAMVSDWTSEYGPGFNHDVRLWYIGGTPWDNPEGYRQKSSLTYIKNVVTPTILFHGINDRTCTEPQSMNYFTALKDQGKTVRYIKFPREPHGPREQRHQRIRDIEEIRWMQKHVLGIEWTPWERKEDQVKKEEEEKEGS